MVTGLDDAAAAVARTPTKRDRLRFARGNFNALDYPEGSFDVIVSLDTLYWASDLQATLSALVGMLKPGGRLAVFMNHHIAEGEPAAKLAAVHNPFAKAADAIGLPFQAFDHSEAICAFWQRNYAAATDLQPTFEAEGNGFIAESLIRESVEEYLPDVEAGRIARSLYLIEP